MAPAVANVVNVAPAAKDPRASARPASGRQTLAPLVPRQVKALASDAAALPVAKGLMPKAIGTASSNAVALARHHRPTGDRPPAVSVANAAARRRVIVRMIDPRWKQAKNLRWKNQRQPTRPFDASLELDVMTALGDLFRDDRRVTPAVIVFC